MIHALDAAGFNMPHIQKLRASRCSCPYRPVSTTRETEASAVGEANRLAPGYYNYTDSERTCWWIEVQLVQTLAASFVFDFCLDWNIKNKGTRIRRTVIISSSASHIARKALLHLKGAWDPKILFEPMKAVALPQFGSSDPPSRNQRPISRFENNQD